MNGNGEPPRVTVIMPIRNEEAFIARSLGAVLGQDYPAERMQVLVADGMSDDATRDVIAGLAEAHPRHTIEIVDNPGRIVPTGFNAALDRATGDVVVRVDGHTIIDDDYVTQCVAALDSVYMGAWPREVFERVGPFDTEMVRNQDDEFNYRLASQGGRILLTDAIRSQYYNRSSLRTLFRQYRQYGHWKVRVLQKHPKQMSARQFAPPALVAALAGGALLAPFSRPVRRLWAVLVGAYALANLGASVSIARRSGASHLRYLPIVFGALHIGYGAGFLGGLVRFRDRWKG